MIHTPAPRDYIYNLSLEFMDPKGAEWAMKRCLNSKVKLQEKIILKDQLMCLKKIGTNETQCLALKIGKKIKFDRETVMERVIRFVMSLKIEDADKDIKFENQLF